MVKVVEELSSLIGCTEGAQSAGVKGRVDGLRPLHGRLEARRTDFNVDRQLPVICDDLS